MRVQHFHRTPGYRLDACRSLGSIEPRAQIFPSIQEKLARFAPTLGPILENDKAGAIVVHDVIRTPLGIEQHIGLVGGLARAPAPRVEPVRVGDRISIEIGSLFEGALGRQTNGD